MQQNQLVALHFLKWRSTAVVMHQLRNKLSVNFEKLFRLYTCIPNCKCYTIMFSGDSPIRITSKKNKLKKK